MRSKFIVKISRKSDNTFPTDDELRMQLRTYGWEPKEITKLAELAEKVSAYIDRGMELFTEQLMPEVAQEEKNDIIFYGYISADQTRFVVTRSNDGEMTFRLLQADLPQLIRATEKVVRALESDFSGKKNDELIINRSVLIYERGFDHIILEGRVVENKYLETIRSNIKDTIVVVLSLFFLFLIASTASAAQFTTINTSLIDTLGRIAVSVTVVFMVSLVGLYLTYRDIKATRLISWNLKHAVTA